MWVKYLPNLQYFIIPILISFFKIVLPILTSVRWEWGVWFPLVELVFSRPDSHKSHPLPSLNPSLSVESGGLVPLVG